MWELSGESGTVSSWSYTDCKAIREKSVSALHGLIRNIHGFFVIQLDSVERYSLMNKGIVLSYWNLLIAPETPRSTIKAFADVWCGSDISPDVWVLCWLICTISGCLVGEIMVMAMPLLAVFVNEPRGLGSDLNGAESDDCRECLCSTAAPETAAWGRKGVKENLRLPSKVI